MRRLELGHSFDGLHRWLRSRGREGGIYNRLFIPVEGTCRQARAPWRVPRLHNSMTVRFLGVVWHLPMVILAACVGASFAGSTYLVAALFRPEGIASGRTASFAALFALLGLASVWALGLFSIRQRAGF